MGYICVLHLEVLPMPTKAKLECQVKFFKATVSQCVREITWYTRQQGSQVSKLQQHNETLCTQLSELCIGTVTIGTTCQVSSQDSLC